jgi:hypothetical protein
MVKTHQSPRAQLKHGECVMEIHRKMHWMRRVSASATSYCGRHSASNDAYAKGSSGAGVLNVAHPKCTFSIFAPDIAAYNDYVG